MNDPSENGRSAGVGSSRLRKAIYGDRQTITVRMGKELNKELMAYCAELQIPANMYVIGLISGALLKNKPESEVTKQSRIPGEPTVVVTLRLDPALHLGLTVYCSSRPISVNAFICGLIHKDLSRRER